LGGQQTLFLTALDQRIKVAVSSCGYSSFAALIRDHINHNFAAYVPGMLLQGDVGDLLASIVPRPYLSLHGQDDPIFPIDGVRQSQKIAQTAYQAAGIPERLKFDEFSGGHTFLSPQRELAYQWLERWL
jgi:predicted esterase